VAAARVSGTHTHAHAAAAGPLHTLLLLLLLLLCIVGTARHGTGVCYFVSDKREKKGRRRRRRRLTDVLAEKYVSTFRSNGHPPKCRRRRLLAKDHNVICYYHPYTSRSTAATVCREYVSHATARARART